ncbi:hypothetical protein AB0H98_01920 [Nocardia salmonicida]|uniref:hypothetical protein n=1 Tax=Nocardia salmonicida TaxID=53431 RepID=UPI0033F6F19B
MSETRQQRRARERAEKKAAAGPGPRPAPVVSVVQVVGPQEAEVRLEWVEPERGNRQGPSQPGYWVGEWAAFEPGQSFDDLDAIGHDTAGEWELAEFIDAIIVNLIEGMGVSGVSSINWVLCDDAQMFVRNEGIELPTSIPAAQSA